MTGTSLNPAAMGALLLASGAIVGMGPSNEDATGQATTSGPMLSAKTPVNPDIPGNPGHPFFLEPPNAEHAPAMAEALGLTSQRGATAPIPPLSPQEKAAYVNFESPPIQSLAVNSDGSMLVVANTPLNALQVFSTQWGPGQLLHLEQTIPVGIDPVAAAFEPGSGGNIVWVSNYISDDLSIVNIQTGRVERVVELGDEPSRIIFSPNGRTAFVILEGGAPTADGQLITPSPALAVVDVGSYSVVTTVDLECNSPRGMAIDPMRGLLYISALRSGNNTTVVGEPRLHIFSDGSNPEWRPGLQIVRDFSVTATIFAASPELSPWPEPAIEPGSPPIHRIIPDAARVSGWTDIIAALTTDTGQLDPAVVAQYNSEFRVINGAQILAGIISEVTDTADNDILVFDITTPASPEFIGIGGGVGTLLTGMAINPVTGQLLVTNMEALNETRHEAALRGHFMDHEVVRVEPYPDLSSEPFDLHEGVPGFNDVTSANTEAQAMSLANPVDITVTPDGQRVFVASLGTGRVGVLDAGTMRVQSVIDVGAGTYSMIHDPALDRVYTYNRTENTVTTLDVSAAEPALHDTVGLFSPEPRDIREGRDFLYSTRFSNNFGSSCAMCHVDAHIDAIAWDLSNPLGELLPAPSNLLDPGGQPQMNHPVKGPMVTMSLRGLRDHNGFHWRGDKPQFEDFNGAFDALLGGTELTDTEMTDFREFVDTIAYSPNPHFTRDNRFKDPRAINGAVVYINNCAGCHTLEKNGALRIAGLTDDAGVDLSAPPFFVQLQEITQLRGIHRKFDMDIYNGFGLVHDGRERRHENSHPIETFAQSFFPNISASDTLDMIAFLNAFQTNVMSIVGWQVRADATVSPVPEFELMLAQATLAVPISEMIARGVVGGQQIGYALEIDPNSGLAVFRSDINTLHSPDEMLGIAAGPGNYLVFEAVPLGSARRMGIDADLDCVLNGLDDFPLATPDLTGEGTKDFFDVLAFLEAWDANEPIADFDGDRSFTFFDVAAFLGQFSDTCTP